VSDLTTSKQECSRWRRRKEDRPAEILAAALKMFTAKGFAATRLDEVAKEAGVSKGTLYLYFESKEILFKAVVSEFVLPHIEKAEEQAEHYEGSIQVLLGLLLEQWRLNVLETELSGIPKIMFSEASNFPELAKFYLEKVILRSRNFVTNLIKTGIQRDEFRQCDAAHAARTFLAPLVFAAIWQHSLAPFDESYNIKEYLDTHLDIFLQGILKDKQG